jgi:hypothetical protein
MCEVIQTGLPYVKHDWAIYTSTYFWHLRCMQFVAQRDQHYHYNILVL